MDSDSRPTVRSIRPWFLTILCVMCLYYAMIAIHWLEDPHKLAAFHIMYDFAVVNLLLFKLSEQNKRKEAEKLDLPICMSSSTELEADKTKSEGQRWKGLILNILEVIIVIAPTAFPISALLAAALRHGPSREIIMYLFVVVLSALTILGSFLAIGNVSKRGAR